MPSSLPEDRCPRCGAPARGGLRGCFDLLSEVLAREYMDPEYGAVHLFTVDAHALQHPEDHGYKNNAFHLVRLCYMLERGGSPAIGRGPRWLAPAFDGRPDIPDLQSPAVRGAITVAHVHAVPNAEEHCAMARAWAESVWEAWSIHHDWARVWLKELWDRL